MSKTRNVGLASWLLLALGASFLAYISRVHEVTHDAFHEMALAREALATGQFPTDDVFAYTQTVSPSVHHEWGTGAILYGATVGTGLGLWGLTVLKCTLIGLLWFVLYRTARLRGAHPAVFAALSIVVFPFFWVGFATIRAQLFTLVFIAIQLWMQELDWRGRRSWIAPWWIMLVVWLNLHAGFVVGLCFLAVHSIERIAASWLKNRSIQAVAKDTWHLFGAGLAAVFALPLNPYGWQYIPYLIHAIGMKRPLIAEWGPLWTTYDPKTTLAAFAISVVLLVHAFRYRQWLRLKGFPNAALCAYMALKHIRHGSIYGVVWLAYVPAWISHTPIGKQLIRLLERNSTRTVSFSKIVAVCCCTFAITHQFWLPTLSGYCVNSETCYPVGAVDYLKRNNFRGNLMTPFHAGAYVSWELHPKVKISLDGRYEVAYQANVFPDHHAFYQAHDGWLKTFEAYASDAILINQDSPVREKLLMQLNKVGALGSLAVENNHGTAGKPKWRVVYEDDGYLVIAHNRIDLPIENHRGKQLPDRASIAFSSAYAARSLSTHQP